MEQTSLLSGSVWLGLPQETRQKLHNLFGLEKSGNVEVFNGPNGAEVRSDGHTYNDLSAITVKKMQEILDSKEEDFYLLFRSCVSLVTKEELVEKVEAVIAEVEAEEEKIEEVIPTPAPRKAGRPKKHEGA